MPSVSRIRLRASGTHLLISFVIASIVAVIVFGIWYPKPYYVLSGGLILFNIVVGVDIIVGPLLTLVVFNPKKPRSELLRDMTVIAALQIGALGYGMHTVFEARPVALVFEVDRFRVIAANTVLAQELPSAPPEFRQLSWTGPKLIAAREPRSPEEKLRALELAIAGYDVGQRPSFWVPYAADAQQRALRQSHLITELIARFPNEAASIKADLVSHGLPMESTRYLPLQAKNGSWLVLLNQTGVPVGFSANNGFL